MRTKVKTVIRFSLFLLLIIGRIHLFIVKQYEKINPCFCVVMSVAAMIGTLGAAALGAAANVVTTRQRNEAQQRENEKAYLREKQQVAEMNVYNSAGAQAARLQAAGLNPNLMYEQSPAQAAGAQQDIAHYQPAELENPAAGLGSTFEQIAGSLVGIREQENKNRLAEAQILVDASVADLNYQQLNLSKAQEKEILETLGYDIELLQQSIREKKWNVKEIRHRIANLDAQTDVLEQEWDLKQEEIEKMDAETRCMLALLGPRINFLNMSAEERFQAASQAFAMAKYITESQGPNTDADTVLKGIEGDMIPKEFTYKVVSGSISQLFDALGTIALLASPAGGVTSLGKTFGSATGVLGRYGVGRSLHGVSKAASKTNAFTPASGKFTYRRTPAPKKR